MLETVRLDRASIHFFDLNLAAGVSGAMQEHRRRPLWVVELEADGISGFGEISSLELPNYSSEWSSGSGHLMKKLILPWLMERRVLDFKSLDWLVGNGASRFGLECALVDLLAKRAGMGLTSFLRLLFDTDAYNPTAEMAFGVAIGAASGWSDALKQLEEASRYGARRVKFKVDRPAALQFLSMSVPKKVSEIVLDFNGCLRREDSWLLRELDRLELRFIEEPSSDMDISDYLRLSKVLDTRLFLDESTANRGFADLARSMCRNNLGFVVKPFRFGSVVRLNNALDLLEKNGISCYLGGMFESAIGRRFLLAFGSHRCFTETGDMAPSNWYFSRDVEPGLFARRGENRLKASFELGSEVSELIGHDCTQECTTFS